MITEVKTATICIIGAGYVGLPLSRAFARSHRVISFDVDAAKVKSLAEHNGDPNHSFTTDPGQISQADFISICVPTPLSRNRRVDMSYIKAALGIVGRYMKRGATVIIESTVYPGATEEICKPVLEQVSGYECGKDFKLAYSPERINPGDSEHGIEKVTKVVAALDEETLTQVAALYHHITPHIFKARNIRTAEAAKLVENAQRDLNIAFINELSIILGKMDISTQDVLDAASTKWNFQRLSPGLVGGYCIPVAPYFLAQKAEECGYHPGVILAGRAINESMPRYIAEMTIKSINETGRVIKGSKVLIMGCTYKENVTDTRETPVRTLIKELQEYGVEVSGYDPLVKDGEKDFNIKFFRTFNDVSGMDCIILAVSHDAFKWLSVDNIRNKMNSNPIIIDIKGFFDISKIHNSGINYKRL